MFQVLEVFKSIQGEGFRAGMPSVFIRMAKCNFRCQGFNNNGVESNEYKKLDAQKYISLKDVPLVTKGCDSFAAWAPEFKHLWKKYTTEELLEEVAKVNGSENLEGVDIVMTGGEPMLPPNQIKYIPLFQEFKNRNVESVTFETNGTQNLTSKFYDYIVEEGPQIIWSISPKLKESGEPREKAIIPAAVKSLVSCPDTISYFKYVVSTEESLAEVKEVNDIYLKHNIKLPTYLMPEGGIAEIYNKNRKRVAEWCMENNFRFSARLHIDIFGNNWGT